MRDEVKTKKELIAELRELREEAAGAKHLNSRLRLAFNAASAGVWEWNPRTNECSWSEEVWPLFGLAPQKQIPDFESWLRTVHPDDRCRVVHALQEVATGGGELNIEWRVSMDDGAERWVMSRGRPVVDAAGLTKCLIGIIIDVTRRKQVEAKLLESEAQIRSISNNLASGMIYQVVRTPDGARQFTYLGNAVRRLYGIAPEEGMANPDCIYGRIHPEDRERVFQIEEEANANMSVFKCELRMINPDGGIRWSSFISNPRLLADGTTCWDGIVFDVTERKLAEEMLKESEQKYRILVNTLNEGIWQIDSDARTVFVNDAMANMLGYGAAEMTGRHLYEFMDDEGMVLAGQLLEKRRQGLKEDHDFEFIRKNGDRIYAFLSTTPIFDKEGGYAGALAAVHDVTKLRRSERALAAYRQGLEGLVKERTEELENKTKTMEELNIALKILLQSRENDKKDMEERFIANIRNLILPFAEKLKNTRLDKEQQTYLGIIETHLNEITSPLIKKLYQFNLTPVEVEVAALIKEGRSTKEIAKIMGRETSSVDTHRNNIRKKLGINNRNVNLHFHLQSLA